MNHEEKLMKTIKTNINIKKCKVGKYVINYAVAGSGKPLLLIHGSNIGWGQWYPNFEFLAKYFKVYALDLPGSGDSSRVNYLKMEVDSYVTTVEEFIKINKLNEVNIVGHSFGGFIAAKLLLNKENIINKVVLVDTMGFTDFIANNQKMVTIYPLVKLIASTVMRPNRDNVLKILNSAFYTTPILRKEFVDYYFSALSKTPLSHPFFFMNSLTDFCKIKKEVVFMKKDLMNIKRPILALHGESDRIISINKIYSMIKLIPNIQLKIIKGSGHVPSIEKSDQFNKLVANYILKI